MKLNKGKAMEHINNFLPSKSQIEKGEWAESQSKNYTISQYTGIPTVQANDPILLNRIQQAFWCKLQTTESISASSPYRLLAVKILSAMALKNYTADDVEKSCASFEMKKTYGDRIEIADFFDEDSKPEEFFTYQKVMEFVHNGTPMTNFDAYVPIPEPDVKPLWRRHDGTKLDSKKFILKVWAGYPIKQ